jgi:hypothetical protein
MKFSSKHLPLLALALLVGSTELRADELPFKVGDRIDVTFVNGQEGSFGVEKIVGKWIYVGFPRVRIQGQKVIEGWINTDTFIQVSVR